MSDSIDSLKQRLVGAFVIVTLAIIFLPMIFDKPHKTASVVVTPIPPKPEFRTIEISKPKQPEFEALAVNPKNGLVEKLSASQSGEESQQADGSSSAKTKAKSSHSVENLNELNKGSVEQSEPTSSKQRTPQKGSEVVVASTKTKEPTVSHLPVFKNVWMVQLGTFTNFKNAYRLRDQLRKDGFDGHTKMITLNGKKAVKVFTGPFVKKREAIKTKKRLDQKYKVDSRIVYFDS